MSDQMDLQLVFDLVDESSKELQKISKNLNNVKKGFDGATKAQKKMASQSKITSSILQKQFNVLNTPLGRMASIGAIAGVLGTAAKKSMEFSDGLAEVATLTDKSAKEIEASFKPIVNQIQRTYGKDSQDVIKALYDGISAGIPATEAAASKYLDAVAKMSIGGRASMEASGDLITTIMNTWQDTGITAEQAANAMFGAVKMGKTTITQLSASFGQVANDAMTAGANVQEVAAAVAALTSIGIKTPETMTKLRSLMKSLKAPAEQAAKAFQSLGIKSIGGMMLGFKENKLFNTLKEVDKRLRKTTKNRDEYNKAVAKLFPDSEAATAFTALMTTANDKFNESLSQTALNAGQVSKALNKMETDAQQVRKAEQELSIALSDMGDMLVPYMAQTAKSISSIFSNVKMIVDNAAYLETLRQEDLKKTDQALGGEVKNYSPEKVGSGIQTILKGLRETSTGSSRISAEELRERTASYQININVSGSSIDNKNAADQIGKSLEKQMKEIEKEKKRKSLSNNSAMSKGRF